MRMAGDKMRIFALSDLHLSTASDKPMEVFGPNWENHASRIKENWLDCVSEEDIVIISGDVSWGLKFREALPDLEWLHRLPGRKVLTKGNHDLWWTSLAKMNDLYEDLIFVQYNYYDAGGVAICGTRGWFYPGQTMDFSEHDEKIFRRELIRLKLSLDAAKNDGFDRIILSIHYPPTDFWGADTEFTDLIEQYNVTDVIYGHIHGERGKTAFGGVKAGIKYRLASSDCVKFRPILICELGKEEYDLCRREEQY